MRLSISVTPEVERTIRTAAEAAEVSVSTWLAQVAQEKAAEQAAIADGLKAVREYEAEYGPINPSPEEQARIRAVLIDAGLIPDEPLRQAW
jgi:metal-dependent amidase/aminoacylase/carboxypeptidase family protein